MIGRRSFLVRDLLLAGVLMLAGCDTSGVETTGAAGSAQNAAGAMSGGQAGDVAGAGGTGHAGAGGDAGASGEAASAGVDAGAEPVPNPGDITALWLSRGCGTDPPEPGPNGVYTIATSGMKDADCADMSCEPWTSTRRYLIFLPENYDKTQPYMLVFEAPGCGDRSNNVFRYVSVGTMPSTGNASNTVIRVGLEPSQEIQMVHATNPNQGCFDDREGDDSADFVFYEALYDQLETQLCFDRNRVFAGGLGSGALLANELGCKYAGDADRPIRGVLSTSGGLPSDPKYQPTCTEHPMAGVWVHDVGDTTYPFTMAIYAINRAMSVDGCMPGQNYQTTQWEDYPIGSNEPDSECKRILGCDPLYPLIVCPLSGNAQSIHTAVADPSGSTFMRSFLSAPLAVP